MLSVSNLHRRLEDITKNYIGPTYVKSKNSDVLTRYFTLEIPEIHFLYDMPIKIEIFNRIHCHLIKKK